MWERDGGRCAACSILQYEFLAQFGRDLVGQFLRVAGMLWRRHHGRPPAEQRISAHRYEHTADHQSLKDHVFEFGVGLCFLFHGDPALSPMQMLVPEFDDFANGGAAYRRTTKEIDG